MKTFVLSFLFIFAFISYSGAIENKNLQFEKEYLLNNESVNSEMVVYPSPFKNFAQGDKWGAFWITFLVSAVGWYFFWFFSVGLVAIAVTYFATNGNKKAVKMSVLGFFAGMILGGGLRLLMLFA